MKKIIFLTVFILFTLIGCNKQQAENVKLQWSEKSPNEMSWDEAKQYCENLDEGGHNDWRLPNIDELRTLIKNHSGTQSGGSCPISEKAEKLSFSRDWTEDCRGRNGSNVSELGDTAFWFWSSSVESENSINRWVVKYDGSVESIYEGRDDYSDLPYVRCVRNPYNSNSKGSYTKSAAKNHTDKIESDSTSKSENTKNEDLGEEQTNAQPKESTNKQGIKEIGNLQWSGKAPTKMEWYNAINYCKTLDEGGHKDWRLPNIDELKTLIQNCPKTEAGGECKVSAESGCLSSRTCRQTVRSCVCENNQGNFNKLGDEGWFWSSSPVSDDGFNEWAVIFDRHSVSLNATYATGDGADSHSVRCVRYNKKTSKTENLQWSKKSTQEMYWLDAVKYCKNMKEGGYSDWRLPNIDELRTLIINHSGTEPNGSCQISEKGGRLHLGYRYESDCNNGDLNINHSKLGDSCKHSCYLWSSSIQSDEPNRAWDINVNGGGIDSHYRGYGDMSNYVRCVRDNKKSTEKEVLETNKKEIATSRNLHWSRKSSAEMDWNDAVNYCENLDEGGYNDWKVPSIDELRTLIQNCPATETGGECGVTDTCLSFRLCSLNACKGCEFDNYGKGKYSKLGDIEQFWSSSVQPKKSRHVTVFFSTGGIEEYGGSRNSGNNYVRCVRY